ncbi:MAG: protein kinase, partial [Planctomycetota bacterium]|nr:protein kinase [Planctomycetota bacterium]
MPGTQDSQIVLVLLRQEILDQETIDKALSLQVKAKEEGREMPLAAVLVQEKFLPFAQVERLVAHQKDEPLVCKSCKTETGARALDPREPFVCPSCSKPLPETDTAMEAFMTMVAPPSSPAKKGLIGQTIAGCRIDRKIGEGGMGAVYEATDEYLDRKVAVKVLPEYHVQQPGFTERFLRESRSAAKVNHPNVVQVMQAGVDGDTHYIVMEFVEGKSLEDILEDEGQIP